MERDYQQSVEVRKYYASYAEELREKFRSGLLAELVPYPQFVVWKHQESEGKPHKPPYSPIHHRLADTTNPQSWGTLGQSLKTLATGNYNGIGFVFSKADPYSMIDLDHCVGNNRSIDTWARDIIDPLQTYTEYSPRDGIHLITEAHIPGQGRKIGSVEMYSSNHFLTLTLNHVPGTPATIEKRQAEHTLLYRALVPEPLQSLHKNTGGVVLPPAWEQPPSPDDAADRRVIDQALQAANGKRFARYWHGDETLWQGEHAERRSKSEADYVLVLYLLSWTGENVEQVKRLFQQSGLYDPQKSDRQTGTDSRTGRPVTYLEMTIYNAIRKRKAPQQKGRLPSPPKEQ
jgi:putative DNA primase/helicase